MRRERASRCQLDSNVAKSSLKGRGSLQISSGYPVNGKLYFSNIKYSNVKPSMNTLIYVYRHA